MTRWQDLAHGYGSWKRFVDTEAQVREWLADGATIAQIAERLGMGRAAARDLARECRAWAPTPDEIRAGCEEIRAAWTDADWAAASRLNR